MSEVVLKLSIVVDGEQVRDEDVLVGEFDDSDERVRDSVEAAFNELLKAAGTVMP